MYRILIEELKKWKDKKRRLPLILQGARQVGKSWLLKEFGNQCFKNTVYVNFENITGLDDVFAGSINPARIISYLSAMYGKKIIPEDTLIIFDEVQEEPRALTSLKYFAEEAPEYAICCAGSLLGVTLHSGTSFPVGKVEFFTLGPLSFREFLLANQKNAICDLVDSNPLEKLPAIIQEQLCDLLKQYMIIGGMPRAVLEWLETEDYSQVTKIQEEILLAYQNDFSKHAPNNVVPRIHHLWKSIPSQLAKENKKFVYGVIREGARAREYEDAILWLRDAGVIRYVGMINSGLVPLAAYENMKNFKIYHLDIGLLRCMSGVKPEIIIRNYDVFREFKGALTEQFVLQELSSYLPREKIYYWSSGATAEVDFVMDVAGYIIPIEAKAGMTVHAKSLGIFKNKYNNLISVKTSMKNISYQDDVLNIPLYVLWNLDTIIRKCLLGDN